MKTGTGLITIIPALSISVQFTLWRARGFLRLAAGLPMDSEHIWSGRPAGGRGGAVLAS